MSIHDEYEMVHLGPDITVEVNWNSSVIPCKAFKITIEGRSAVVSRDEMFGLLFLFADEKQQEDLIPVKEVKVRAITRLLTFTAKKNIPKGGKVSATFQYFVPETVYEKLLLDPKKYQPGALTENDLEKDINKIV